MRQVSKMVFKMFHHQNKKCIIKPNKVKCNICNKMVEINKTSFKLKLLALAQMAPKVKRFQTKRCGMDTGGQTKQGSLGSHMSLYQAIPNI